MFNHKNIPIYSGGNLAPRRSPTGMYSQRSYLNWLAHEATRKADLMRMCIDFGVVIPYSVTEGFNHTLSEIERIKRNG